MKHEALMEYLENLTAQEVAAYITCAGIVLGMGNWLWGKRTKTKLVFKPWRKLEQWINLLVQRYPKEEPHSPQRVYWVPYGEPGWVKHINMDAVVAKGGKGQSWYRCASCKKKWDNEPGQLLTEFDECCYRNYWLAYGYSGERLSKYTGSDYANFYQGSPDDRWFDCPLCKERQDFTGEPNPTRWPECCRRVYLRSIGTAFKGRCQKHDKKKCRRCA